MDLRVLELNIYVSLGGTTLWFVQRRHEIKYFETWEDLKTSLVWWFGERDDPERKRLQAKRDKSVFFLLGELL